MTTNSGNKSAVRHYFWAFVAVSLTMRLFALYLAHGVPHVGDPAKYLQLAQAFTAGHGLSLPRTENAPWVATALYPPGLPVLLGSIGVLVPLSAFTLCVLNTLIDVAAALLLGRMATLLRRRDLALPLGLAYLVWPSIALMAPLAYKEGLFIALLLASLVAFVEHTQHGGFKWAVASGIAAGGMILTQPAATPFLPLAFFALKPCFNSNAQWFRAALIAGVVAVLALIPWWIRNALVFDTFIPLTSSGGLALWQGAHLGGGMRYQTPPASWAEMGELAAAKVAQEVAWEIIVTDPIGYLGRCLAKFPASFFMSNWAVDQLVFAQGQPLPGLAKSVSLRMGPAFVELSVAVLAVIGLIRRPGSLPARLLWASLAQVMIFGIWFEFSERHRSFITPFLLLMVAATVSQGSRRTKLVPATTLD